MFVFVPLIIGLPVLSLCPINSNFSLWVQYIVCLATILHDMLFLRDSES